VFAVVVCALMSVNIAFCLGATTAGKQHLSREQAIALARQITGYPKAKIASAKLRQVEGSVFPFGRPKKRLTWEVTLQDISLTTRGGTNQLIKGLKVLLEVDTGHLIRIDSVPFVSGSLKKFASGVPDEAIRSSQHFIGLSAPQKVNFAQAITADYWPTAIAKATGVTAYLVTLSNSPNSGLPLRASYWIILAGGFHAHIFSFNKPSTEAMYVIWAWDLQQGMPATDMTWFWP
jgi:hypothetical protein